jgi:hypothetical protein
MISFHAGQVMALVMRTVVMGSYRMPADIALAANKKQETRVCLVKVTVIITHQHVHQARNKLN